VATPEGCLSGMRIAGAIASFIAGGLFLRQMARYDREMDAIIRIPFVFGALIIGLLLIGFGIWLLVPKGTR
jgi:hypothetical protein